MDISYELNPPKIIRGGRFDLTQLSADMEGMAQRASEVDKLAGRIHLTDSVLGIPRVSSITAAKYIRGLVVAKLSCSIRVRDRNFTSLCQAVSDAIMIGVDSLLVVMGDDPADGPSDSGLRPTTALEMLRKEGYGSNIRLDLSFPASVRDKSTKSIQKKLDAKPHSFVTQSISSLSDLGEIVDLAKPHGIRVTAVVMVPAEKNRQSASIIGLDWSEYQNNPAEFIRQAARISDSVLISSPGSFSSGLELLSQLR